MSAVEIVSSRNSLTVVGTQYVLTELVVFDQKPPDHESFLLFSTLHELKRFINWDWCMFSDLNDFALVSDHHNTKLVQYNGNTPSKLICIPCNEHITLPKKPNGYIGVGLIDDNEFVSRAIAGK